MSKATLTKICPVCRERFYRDSGSSDPNALSTGKKHTTHVACAAEYRRQLKARQELTRSLNTAYNTDDFGWLFDTAKTA